MAKTENIFQNFDFTKALTEFDITKFAKDLKVPNMEVERLFETHKRNIEAISSAGQVVAEGFQAFSKRQAEIVRETLENAGDAVRNLMATTSPEESANRQADIAKQSLERAMSNMRELVELATKANNEAAEVLNQRLLDNLDDLKTMLPKRK